MGLNAFIRKDLKAPRADLLHEFKQELCSIITDRIAIKSETKSNVSVSHVFQALDLFLHQLSRETVEVESPKQFQQRLVVKTIARHTADNNKGFSELIAARNRELAIGKRTQALLTEADHDFGEVRSIYSESNKWAWLIRSA